MTYMNQTAARAAPMDTGRGIAALLRGWRAAQAKRRIYRRTLAELDGLTDRELQDLGIARSMVRAVAHEAVYG